LKWWIKVEGIMHADVRQLSEKIGEQPEQQSETEKSAEFSIPSWMVSTWIEILDCIII
jgi:hypothetical protein